MFWIRDAENVAPMAWKDLRSSGRGFAIVVALFLATLVPAAAQTGAQGPSVCPPSIDGRVLGTQLQDMIVQLGPLTPDLRARIGLLQSVLQARDAAAARGECDFSVYDAQLTMLVNDVRTLAAGIPPGPAVGAPMPPTASPAPAPPMAPATPSTPAAGSDIAAKLGDVMQMLLGKLGSGGSGATGGATSDPMPAPSAPPASGMSPGGPGTIGTAAPGGLVAAPPPGTLAPRAPIVIRPGSTPTPRAQVRPSIVTSPATRRTQAP